MPIHNRIFSGDYIREAHDLMAHVLERDITMKLSRSMMNFPETCRAFRRRLQRLVRRIRWGTITERMTATAGGGVPAEYEYRDRKGRVIGYWAYGSWDPNLPYKDE